MDFRFKEDIEIVQFPEGNEEDDRGFKDCCSDIKALADTSDTDPFKNDKWGVSEKKQTPTDIINFTIEKCGLGVLPNLGTVGVFPNDTGLVGFVYDWRQYLDVYGPGRYTTKVVFTIAGISKGVLDANFELKAFSTNTSNYTVRIWSQFNSYYEKKDADYTDSNFESMIRFDGRFGDRKPKTVINHLIDTGKKAVKTTHRNENEYTLLSDGVGINVVRPIFDFFNLNQDLCFVSDYNKGSLDYSLKDKPVALKEVPDPAEIPHTRKTELTIIYSDRVENDNSLYNKG